MWIKARLLETTPIAPRPLVVPSSSSRCTTLRSRMPSASIAADERLETNNLTYNGYAVKEPHSENRPTGQACRNACIGGRSCRGCPAESRALPHGAGLFPFAQSGLTRDDLKTSFAPIIGFTSSRTWRPAMKVTVTVNDRHCCFMIEEYSV